MNRLSITEARAKLPEVVDRVEEGEETEITRHGKVVAVLVHPDRVRRARSSELYRAAAALHDAMEQARRQPLRSTYSDPALAEQRVAELRADRDAG